MAPFSIPAPHINPLQAQNLGTRRTIDTQTKIELVCETFMKHEIFFTVDGTKPQPYAGIIQGSKLFKYSEPFCLPPGKISVKAIALNAQVRTIRSNVVTKCFEVRKSENEKPKKIVKAKKKKKQQVTSTELSVQRKLFGSEDMLDKDYDDAEKDLCLENPPTSVENFPQHYAQQQPSEEDVTSESGHSLQSVASAQEGEDPLNIATCESAQVTPLSSAPQSPAKKPYMVGDNLENGIGDVSKVANKSCGCNIKSESPPCCLKCSTSLQVCVTCNSTNEIASKFCIQCGRKLMIDCVNCRQFNYAIATFCQFCGQKLQPSESVLGNNSSLSPKSKKHNKSVQRSPSLLTKQTQTLVEKKNAKKSPQKLPSHSPGRGYWHQQLDYICNHLKSYAYNNNEFRESISEPMLCDFQSAKVTKDLDSVSITLKFSPYIYNEKL